eukprot:scaffold2352_cov103-Isochrysis_galbana.AAC.5
MAQRSRRDGGYSKLGAGRRIQDGILGVRVVLIPLTQLFVADWPAVAGLELPKECFALIGIRIHLHAAGRSQPSRSARNGKSGLRLGDSPTLL